MQLIFEFCAAETRPVVEAVLRVLGDAAYTLKGGFGGNEVSMDGGIGSAMSKLDNCEIDSFIAFPGTGPIRYAMVTSPVLGADPLSLYMGTVEYAARDYQWIWDRLMSVTGLTVICLGFEEGVELRDGRLEVDTFPWDEWPLVIGAVRATDASGRNVWLVKNGPEIRWMDSGLTAK